MQTVNCPNCGAEVTFRSPALPIRVCDYCHTAVMRIEDGVRAMGQIAVLPFDVSPLQIGSRGRVDGQAFDIVGRVRWGWGDGFWNEWLMLFGDGTHAWLGEAMGDFMFLREQDVGSLRSRLLKRLVQSGEAAPGEEAQEAGIAYKVVDQRIATCVGSEGELPFTAPADWLVYSVDLRSPGGECASFQRDRNQASFYVGRYVTLAELRMSGLRQIEGWAAPSYA
ncbi:protein of unknown function [Sphingomonas laterariae]|uniref:DUF4178 domain-containing protein n=1 Tax=Edaphosphingomonas laterariae TaxID=861865 RepID=A0A239D1B4_9SPHN|nr:DUF4178 domain-containing protein [Sphingomonas laterariae]SNS25999.1 protein of unknown function [Sphingomonas laterariae]